MNLKRFSGLVLGTASGGLLFMAQPSCSVIVNDFKTQCTSNQDCIDLAAKQPLGTDGKPITGLVCSDQHVCVQKGCRSNAECQDANNGEAYICRSSDRTCQSLILDTPDGRVCDVLADPEDLRNENTIYVGAVVFYAPGSNQGLELTRQDFNKLAGGLPPASATGARRPLAFVYCEGDTIPDTDHYAFDEGAAHLVNDLQLPAIITSLDTTSEINLLNKYSIANGNQVFQLSTSAGGETLKGVDNQGLLLDLVLINENYDKEAFELVKGYYVPLLQAPGGPLAGATLPRVAVLHSSTPTYANTARKIVSELEGANITSQVQDFGYGTADEPQGTEGQHASVVSDVLAFKPHVIIVLGDDEIGPAFDEMDVMTAAGIDVPIENGWTDAAGSQPRPQWLGILGAVGQLSKDIGTLDSAAQIEWGSRALFIQQHYDFKGELFTSYYNQLKQLVPADDPAGVLSPELSSPYNEFLREGAYLTAYSIALLAAQGEPVTGPNLAAAARSFGAANSAKFEIGPDKIFPALQSIASTKHPFNLLTFQGWTGFDENGFATYDFADDVACLTPDVDAMSGMPIVGSLEPTGGIFDGTGALTGTVTLTANDQHGACAGH